MKRLFIAIISLYYKTIKGDRDEYKKDDNDNSEGCKDCF